MLARRTCASRNPGSPPGGQRAYHSTTLAAKKPNQNGPKYFKHRSQLRTRGAKNGASVGPRFFHFFLQPSDSRDASRRHDFWWLIPWATWIPPWLESTSARPPAMGSCVGRVAFFVETTADYGPLWLESTSARSPAMGSCVSFVAFSVETTADYGLHGTPWAS